MDWFRIEALVTASISRFVSFVVVFKKWGPAIIWSNMPAAVCHRNIDCEKTRSGPQVTAVFMFLMNTPTYTHLPAKYYKKNPLLPPHGPSLPSSCFVLTHTTLNQPTKKEKTASLVHPTDRRRRSSSPSEHALEQRRPRREGVSTRRPSRHAPP